MKKQIRIILASRSPARRKLLKQLGISFECHTSGYEEDMNARKTPKALATFLAFNKAAFIARQYPDAIIIGADTFGTQNGKKLGKPKTISEAKKIIRGYSNTSMRVHTGVALITTDKAGKITKKLTDHAVTTLHFGEIPEEEINKIVKKDDVLNVAGALTIEGEAGKFIHTIHGDYHNVIGLPLFQVEEMLEQIQKL